ncbi:FAD:protein FMN transferase [Sandaracinus amylolyticus]|uniref:FAD:protein FMN transferase n=1 Tax=Sandaracinus amylolyticus TaxID=927083 RepID=UPI001F4242DE|nr:FAD:protein FMN transferase [Sandaracinus amylolyticus]
MTSRRRLARSVLPFALVIALALVGCGSSASEEPAPPPRREASRPAEPGRAPASEVPLVRGSRPIMSTLYQITIVSDDEARAHRAIDAALDEVERLGVVLSEWRPDSEVSRINEAAGRAPVQVGADTMANVRESLRIAEWTDGAYDITWAALRDFYLFQPGEARVPDMDAVRARLPLVNWRDVIVDEAASTVMLRREGQAIGLGGIAKGWAVDRAGAVLQEHGFRDFMIFGGGQVLVHGARGDRGWRVGIQHPRRSDYIGFVEATDASIATSGDYEHAFRAPDGTHWHHIIDLTTGLPARGTMSVTIIAPTGLLADGLDTGCFVMGPERCLAMLERLPERVDAVIIDADLKVWTTPGLRERLTMRVELDAEGRLPR